MFSVFFALAGIVFFALGFVATSLGLSVDNVAGSALVLVCALGGIVLLGVGVTGIADGRG